MSACIEELVDGVPPKTLGHGELFFVEGRKDGGAGFGGGLGGRSSGSLENVFEQGAQDCGIFLKQLVEGVLCGAFGGSGELVEGVLCGEFDRSGELVESVLCGALDRSGELLGAGEQEFLEGGSVVLEQFVDGVTAQKIGGLLLRGCVVWGEEGLGGEFLDVGILE